jgi:hypothetical protein
MKKKLVKQDIGFFEYPLWFQDSQMAEKTENGFIWADRDGFIYRAGYKPPTKLDSLFLLYLLYKNQEGGWNKTIEISRFEILKACGVGTSKREYKRLEDSLERWSMVRLEFKGTFYDGKTYQVMNFGVIDSWKIEEGSRKLQLEFSSLWLEKIKNSVYYKIIDFEQFKALRSPLATRLYEILIKSFQIRNDWFCGAKKLATKIPMQEKYAAHIIPKIQAAVRRINEKTELQIKLEVKRPERGKAIFYFFKTSVDKVMKKKEKPRELLVESKRVPKKKEEPESVESPKKEGTSFQELVALLPKEHQEKKTIQDEISKHLLKNGADYVRGNILYSNQNATDKYRSYLNKALKENWGEGYLEDLQQKDEKKRLRKVQEEKKREQEKKQQDLEQKAHDRFQALTPQQHKKLEKEAKERLQTRDSSFLQGSFASVAIKMQMKVILIEQIKGVENE